MNFAGDCRSVFPLRPEMRSFLIYVLTFGWIWRWGEAPAEMHLAETLEQHGDESLAARHATNAFSQACFAARFGRRAPSTVREVINNLDRQGVPLSDLRVLVANRLLIAQDGKAVLRKDLNLVVDYWIGWLMPIIGIVMQGAVLHCIYRHCGVIPWLPVLAATLFMSLGYYFLGLYTIQPYALLRRHRMLIAM